MRRLLVLGVLMACGGASASAGAPESPAPSPPSPSGAPSSAPAPDAGTPPSSDAAVTFQQQLPPCFKGSLVPRATAAREESTIDGWTVVGTLVLRDASPTFPPPPPIARRLSEVAASHGCEAILIRQGSASWTKGPAWGERLLPQYQATCLVHAASCGD